MTSRASVNALLAGRLSSFASEPLLTEPGLLTTGTVLWATGLIPLKATSILYGTSTISLVG
jgi:hypothetical protein